MSTPESSDPRRRILDAARVVFAEGGYRGGSLNDVAKRAGYTRAGLLHHFASKEAMFLALLDERDERLEIFGESWTTRGFLDLVDAMPSLVALILKDRALVQLAHIITAEAAAKEHPARQWAARRHGSLRDLTIGTIRRSIDHGELPADIDTAALAALTLAFIEGLENQWLVNPSVDPVDCSRTFAHMIKALVPPRTGRPARGMAKRF